MDEERSSSSCNLHHKRSRRLEYAGYIGNRMGPAVECREHLGRGLADRSISPVKSRRSPQRKSPPRRERSPTRRRSPPTARSPKRAKSPPKEKVPGRVRSPTHAWGRSPMRSCSSRSPSPRTKRIRRSQAEREPEKVKGGEHLKSSREERNKGGERELKERRRTSSSSSPSPRSKRLMRAQDKGEGEKIEERDHGKNSSREERDKGRHGERGGARDALGERSSRGKIDGGLSRSSRRDRSFSPKEHNHRSKHDSRPPSRAGGREEVSKSRAIEQFRNDNLDSVAKMKAAEESLEATEKDKQKPSFELSGKLAEETNRVRGVTLLFNELADARKPDIRWRLYVFKAGEVLNEPLYVHRQSCYLFGRERRVADIPTDHPSCSKQHAVIQHRVVEKEQPDGLLTKQVRPYIMDLGSTNGTFINDNRIEAQRYYELFEKDTIRFGNSSREYVILHENSVM